MVPDVKHNKAYISFVLVHSEWRRGGIGTYMIYHLPYLFDLPPWALIKFLDLESGRLFEAGRLLNFHHFKQVKYV